MGSVAHPDQERRIEPKLDTASLALRGRIGAYARLAKHGTQALSRAGNRAFMARFEREVDPDGTLPPAERARRAAFAKRAYFSRLALRRRTKPPTRAPRRRGGTP